MPDNPPPFQDPQIRLRKTGTRRDSRTDVTLSERIFLPRKPKGKAVYGPLVFLLVVAGFLLQLRWMQHVRKSGASEITPNAFASQLGQWMLESKRIAPQGDSLDASGAEKINCELCMGSGRVRSDSGASEICPICLGIGFHLIRRFDPSDRICPFCGGMGRVMLPDNGLVGTCPRCDGRGLIRSQAETPSPAEGI